MSMTMNTLLPFEARHKPQHFTDLVFAQDAVRKQLADYAQYTKHGNLMLHGPYGTAKSGTARVIVQERLIACGIPDGNLVQVHARYIKGKIEHVGNYIALLLATNFADDYPYVIIDELDQLTAAEQLELRALLDTHTTIKLIGTTNHLSAVDGGLLSRSDCVCVMPPQPQDWLLRAQQILAAENVLVPDAALLSVLALSQDAREIMRNLEQLVLTKQMQNTQNAAAPAMSVVPNTITLAMPSAAAANSVAPVVSGVLNTASQSGANTP